MSNSIEGVRLSGLPNHPRTRVIKPKPFQRPTTTVAAREVKRDWRTVPAMKLDCGDTVPGIGTISHYRITAGKMIVLGGLGNVHTWDMAEPVFAFTAAIA